MSPFSYHRNGEATRPSPGWSSEVLHQQFQPDSGSGGPQRPKLRQAMVEMVENPRAFQGSITIFVNYYIGFRVFSVWICFLDLDWRKWVWTPFHGCWTCITSVTRGVARTGKFGLESAKLWKTQNGLRLFQHFSSCFVSEWPGSSATCPWWPVLPPAPFSPLCWARGLQVVAQNSGRKGRSKGSPKGIKR